MTSPPVHPVEALPHDLPALVQLEEAAFDDPWTATAIASELDAAASLVLVLRREDRLAGWCSLRVVAPEAELLRLAVHPLDRRKGFGQLLLKTSLTRVRGRGAVRIFLEVREDNAPALGLYHRLGFQLLGKRRGYYRDGTAATLLSLDL